MSINNGELSAWVNVTQGTALTDCAVAMAVQHDICRRVAFPIHAAVRTHYSIWGGGVLYFSAFEVYVRNP